MKPLMLAASIPPSAVIAIIVGVLILFSILLFVISRYRRCPSDKVMVIYGKVGTNKDGTARSAKCIHGGAASRPGVPSASPPSPAPCRTPLNACSA